MKNPIKIRFISRYEKKTLRKLLFPRLCTSESIRNYLEKMTQETVKFMKEIQLQIPTLSIIFYTLFSFPYYNYLSCVLINFHILKWYVSMMIAPSCVETGIAGRSWFFDFAILDCSDCSSFYRKAKLSTSLLIRFLVELVILVMSLRYALLFFYFLRMALLSSILGSCHFLGSAWPFHRP